MRTKNPATPVALAAFALSFCVLVANGRAIGSGDTHAMERTAGALVERGTVILPEDSLADPFTRAVPNGRVSIYPVLPALLAAPLFMACRLFFDLGPAGLQVAGKLAAAFLAALATSLLARSFTRRAPPGLALAAALLFGLGTSVYSTAQALWQHPAVLLFLVIAIDALGRLERSPSASTALIAALGLSLAAASRPAAIPLCGALFIHLLIVARARAFGLLGVACIPAGAVALYNAAFFGAPWRFGPAGVSGRFFEGLPWSLPGLLVSPARGLLLFTPIALVAMWGLIGQRRRPLARALMAAAAVHLVFMACWNEWHGGESFGPRLLTDALPALFFFLPEGLAALPRTGAALGLFSFAVQLLGGWTYDYRWERLHQRGQEFEAALWSWSDSPLAFAVREGVVTQGIPEIEQRRVRLRLHRFVPFGPEGSLIEGTPGGLRISGAALVRDVRLERGARIAGGWMSLTHPGDAVAFRAGPSGLRSVRLTGSLDGVLRIDTPSGSTSIASSGDFDVTTPVQLAPGEELSVRAQTGDLRLGRVEARTTALNP